MPHPASRWARPAGQSLAAAHAQAPDTILINGKIVVYDAAPAQALAVRDGKIAAIGSSADIRALAGPATRVIDLGGRTVIPGLIDSHIHAIRAGLTWHTEVHWIGVRTLAEALDRIRDKAATAPKGSWLDRRRRLDRTAVQGGPPADARRDRRRRARPSRLHPAALQPRAARPRRL